MLDTCAQAYTALSVCLTAKLGTISTPEYIRKCDSSQRSQRRRMLVVATKLPEPTRVPKNMPEIDQARSGLSLSAVYAVYRSSQESY